MCVLISIVYNSFLMIICYILGQGSFGVVNIVINRCNNQVYAAKCLQYDDITEGVVRAAARKERDAMFCNDHVRYLIFVCVFLLNPKVA